VAIGIQEEHEELRSAVQGWAEARDVAGAVRTALDAAEDALPPYWADLAGQGLLAIHLAEEFGGQGAGLVELAVVAEELGRAAAVGPWDTTAIVAGVIAAAGGAGLAKSVLPGMADGSLTAGGADSRCRRVTGGAGGPDRLPGP
jgi:alkylation response protein AidB-like acyl-CoA dehydrogenase